ncbi:MAG: hypothetical protein EOO01_14120 [Chitinophagaceae bacterium]|nr:MAG: hypothetical protein EOO01_14120 [Chitinophagaceae bacterium]
MKIIPASGRVILLISFCLLFAYRGFAQTQIGLRLGANASRVTGNSVYKVQQTGIGFNAGFFYRINLGGVHLQPEMVVSSRNFGFSQDVDTLDLCCTMATSRGYPSHR